MSTSHPSAQGPPARGRSAPRPPARVSAAARTLRRPAGMLTTPAGLRLPVAIAGAGGGAGWGETDRGTVARGGAGRGGAGEAGRAGAGAAGAGEAGRGGAGQGPAGEVGRGGAGPGGAGRAGAGPGGAGPGGAGPGGAAPGITRAGGGPISLLPLADPRRLVAAAPLDDVLLEYPCPEGLVRICGRLLVTETATLVLRGRERAVLQRRSNVRVPVMRSVSLKPRHGGRIVDCQTIDLSGGGMLVCDRADIDVDREVLFSLLLTPDAPPVRGLARVLVMRPGGERALGFEQLAEDERERLIRFVFDRMRAARGTVLAGGGRAGGAALPGSGMSGA